MNTKKLVSVSILVLLLTVLLFTDSFSRPAQALYTGSKSNISNPFGDVRTAYQDDTYTYVGGRLEGTQYKTGGMMIFNPVDDTYKEFNFQGFTSSATETNIAIPDGAGGWYVGGALKKFNGAFIDGVGSTGYALVHINSTDQIIGYWLPTASNSTRVMTLMMDGTSLYVGGLFSWTDGNSIVHSNIVRLNTVSDSLDSTMTLTATGASSYVRSISSDATYIYFGGRFTTANGTNLSPKYSNFRVLKSNVNVRDTGWGMPFSSSSDAILKIVPVGNVLIVSTTRKAAGFYNFLFKADNSTGALVGWINSTTFSTLSPVYDFLVDGSNVYVTGDLKSVGGYTNKQVLRINFSSGAVDTSWIPNTYYDVFSTGVGYGLAKLDGKIYAYGTFFSKQDVYKRLITFDDTNGTISDPTSSWRFGQNYNPNPTSHPPAMTSSGNSLILYAESENGVSAFKKLDKAVYRYVTATGAEDTDWGVTASYTPGNVLIHNIVPYGSNSLILLGNFDSINGVSKNGIAKINKSTGVVDPDFTFDVSYSTSGGPTKGIIVGDYLYVTGFFTAVNGVARQSSVKINLTNNTIDPDWNLLCDDRIYDIAYDNGNIYLAGYFDNIGGLPRAQLARVSASNATVDTGWIANSDYSVDKVSVDENGVYIAGDFSTINGEPLLNFGKLSKTDASIDPNWSYGTNNYLRFMEIVDGFLYLGGNMTTVGALAQPYLARITLATGVPDDTFRPSVPRFAWHMSKIQNGIFFATYLDNKISVDTIPLLHQINNLPELLDAKNEADGLNIEGGSTNGLTSSSSTVRLAKSSLVLADMVTNMGSDRDWSTVNADVDADQGKSFVHNLASAPGASSTYTLYVPANSGDSSVAICPGAASLSDVSSGCTGGVSFLNNETKTVSFSSGDSVVTVSQTTIGGQLYWAAAGVRGTGGVSIGVSGGPTSTPTPTPSTSSSSSSTSSGSGGTATKDDGYCSTEKPDHVPDLFQIDRIGNSAKLYFAPVSRVDGYAVVYGETPREEFGVTWHDAGDLGVHDFTINELKPGISYYFKIRAIRGCSASDWGNWRKLETTLNRVIKPTQLSASLQTPTPSANPSPSVKGVRDSQIPENKRGGFLDWIQNIFN